MSRRAGWLDDCPFPYSRGGRDLPVEHRILRYASGAFWFGHESGLLDPTEYETTQAALESATERSEFAFTDMHNDLDGWEEDLCAELRSNARAANAVLHGQDFTGFPKVDGPIKEIRRIRASMEVHAARNIEAHVKASEERLARIVELHKGHVPETPAAEERPAGDFVHVTGLVRPLPPFDFSQGQREVLDREEQERRTTAGAFAFAGRAQAVTSGPNFDPLATVEGEIYKRNLRTMTADALKAHGIPVADPSSPENLAAFVENDRRRIKTELNEALYADGMGDWPALPTTPVPLDQYPPECLAVIEQLSFNVGNAVRCLWPHGPGVGPMFQQIQQALWYLNREVARLERAAEEEGGDEDGED